MRFRPRLTTCTTARKTRTGVTVRRSCDVNAVDSTSQQRRGTTLAYLKSRGRLQLTFPITNSNVQEEET